MNRKATQLPAIPDSDEEEALDERGQLPAYGADDEIPESERRLAEFMQELEGETGVKINVYRMPGAGERHQAFCFTCSPDNYDLGDLLSRIQSDFGGGRYQIVARNRTGFLTRSVMEVAPAPKHPEPRPSSQQEMTSSIVQAVAAAMQPMMEPLAKLAQRQPADSKTQMMEMLAMMRAMREAMGLGAPGEPATRSTPESLLGKLKEMAEFREQLKALGMGGDDEGGNPLISLALAFKEPLMDIVKKLSELPPQQLRQSGVQLPLLLGGDAPPGAPPRDPSFDGAGPVSPIPTAGGNAMNPVLVPYLPDLVRYAQMGANPESTASLIIDLVPNGRMDELANFVADDNAVSRLVAVYPGAAAHRDWLELLRQSILGEMTEPEPDDDVSGNPPAARPGSRPASPTVTRNQ